MRTALYTTIYPGVERFLGAWATSVAEQDDPNFDLVVGVDSLRPDGLAALLRDRPPITWIPGKPGDTPAQVRQRAFDYIVSEYDAIVCVDSDDVLYRTRVKAAKAMLSSHDVVACSLKLIDEAGTDLGIKLGLEPGSSASTILPRYNVFGLSNTSWNTAALKPCLPVPDECVLVDWYLATGGWFSGARMAFDASCQMAYRQYCGNTARVLRPFTNSQIVTATNLVLSHYDLVFGKLIPAHAEHRPIFEEARQYVCEFHDVIVADTKLLENYVAALNKLTDEHIWWSCVAHPKLEQLWKNSD